jgi:hypothetical protein
MRISKFLLSLPSALLLCCMLEAGQSDTPATAKISGTVINQVTQKPMEGVDLWLKPGSGVYVRGKTDAEGKFIFPTLPARRYDISLSHSGFVESELARTPRHLTLNAGDEIKDLQFEMIPTRAISGRVLDPNGRPLVPAIVVAMKVEYLNGRRVLLPGAMTSKILYIPIGPDPNSMDRNPDTLSIGAIPQQAKADDRGEYRVFDLAPGEYYLAIWQKGDSDDPTVDLPPVYYPGVTDPAAAVPVPVTGTGDIFNIDIRVPSINGYSVRFKSVAAAPPFDCVPPNSSPEISTMLTNLKSFMLVQRSAKLDVVHFAGMRALDRDRSSAGNYGATSRFRAIGDRQWETGKLPPGSYEMYIGGCMGAGLRAMARFTFDITNRDIDVGVVQESEASFLRGQIDAAPGTTVSFGDLSLRLRPTDWRAFNPVLAPNPTPVGRLKVSADGTFAFQHNWSEGVSWGTVAPGHYQVDVAGLPPEVYVSSIKFDAREVRDSGFDVGHTITSNLEITLDSPGGTVSGTVRNSQGQPVANARVAVIAQPIDGAVALSPSTYTDQSGAFLFRGIAPGAYTVFAWERVPNGAYDSADFLMPYQSRGSKALIEKGQTANVDLRLIENN